VAIATKVEARPWGSSVGKKAVMAASGVVMLHFLIGHMIGNLKVFAGRTEFNHYAAWLRTVGEPALPRRVFLGLLELVLTLCVVAHVVTAAQLWRRSRRARPIGYAKRPPTYATQTMRWGGVIVALFVVYHLLDLTFRVANPLGRRADPYDNLIASFREWPVTLFYVLALLAVGLHIRHGIASALLTLGWNVSVGKAISTATAVVLTVGFLSVPLAVLIGLVR